MSQPSVNVNNVDYGRGLKDFGDKKITWKFVYLSKKMPISTLYNLLTFPEYLLRPFTAQQRSVPSRRLSENASTQSRLSMYAQNDKHWSSSEASAGQYTRAASMAMESREPPNYGR